MRILNIYCYNELTILIAKIERKYFRELLKQHIH